MNEHFKKAEQEIKNCIEGLQKILGEGGEDISYYNPEVLDLQIQNIVSARSNMALGGNTWRKASEPPKGTHDKWTDEVVTVTNHGNVYLLTFMHGESGGYWQRPEAFEIGEEVEWWIDKPN
ncbi:MAG: hypothetical protein K6L74_16805 [Neptuniibacter sp.]